jgi:tetratricopeptide (TPR) repeat protein
MKRTIMLLIFVFAFSAVFAQKNKVTSAQNLKNTGKLDQALKTINEAVDTSNDKAVKSYTWPKAWETRGEIFQAIFQSSDENVKKLVNDPLAESFKSYKEAIKLDAKGSFEKSIKIKLTLLTNDFLNQASEAFNNDDYSLAMKSFETILEINELPLIKMDNPDLIDTVIIFNAGLAAYNAQDYDNATKYFYEAAKYGYDGGRTYTLIASAYQLKGTASDTLKALDVLKEGFEKYPEDNGVLTSMIQIYLDLDRTEDAMKYLELAIAQDPNNATFYYAQATLYDKIENEENAIKMYEKSLSIDPKYFNSNYNLGVLYYNKGVKQIEVANAIPPNESARYDEEIKKADIWWEKALPYMEKCKESNPEDVMTLESLKNLYYRLKDMDKYNAILELLGQ